MRALLLVALALASGCAALASDPGSGDGDGDSGGGGSDGCRTTVDFTPLAPVAGPGATVVARSTVIHATGIITYAWTITHDGATVGYTALAGDRRDVEFPVATAGIYDVTLTVGSWCQPFYGQLNVMPPGANHRVVRLRFVPPPALQIPPQEQIVTITGGGDQSTAIIALDSGHAFPLAVRGPEAQPVAAYLRFVSRTTPDAVVEAFSDATGTGAVRLVAGLYDVLVVPTAPTLAPRLITGFDPFTAVLTVDGGTVLTGVVQDGDGAPVAGARVSVTSGATPSTVATTAADGSYTLRWRDDPAALETLTVAPPVAGALPRLVAEVSLADHGAVDVRYAALASRDLAGTVVRIAGVPAAATDVVVHARVAAAATLVADDTVLATVDGSYRRQVRTDAAGALPALWVAPVPGAIYAGAGGGAAATADLATATALDLAVATATGRVLRHGGAPLAGATVRASLLGDLGFAGAPAPVAIADGDGRFTLAIAAGVPYQLVVTDPTAADAERTLDLAGAASTELGELRLPAALALSGDVRTTGQSAGVGAVGVAALCHLDCTGIDRARPLGSAVTDAAGKFVVAIPDPGVTP